MILDMKNLDTWRMLGLADAALILALSVLVIRYGHTKYPYDDKTTVNNSYPRIIVEFDASSGAALFRYIETT